MALPALGPRSRPAPTETGRDALEPELRQLYTEYFALVWRTLRRLGVSAPTLEDAVRLLLSGEQREFPVVDNDQRLEGLLTRDHLIRGLSERGPGGMVRQVMATPVGSIGPGAPFDTALDQLRASGLPALPVVDEMQRVVGLITTDNIADLILVRRHMPARQ